ncbi:MAG: cell division protein SepF [Oscillospiraceae bacterium]|nr:cell division protein SepF [Oscillospiraceae bacterium]
MKKDGMLTRIGRFIGVTTEEEIQEPIPSVQAEAVDTLAFRTKNRSMDGPAHQEAALYNNRPNAGSNVLPFGNGGFMLLKEQPKDINEAESICAKFKEGLTIIVNLSSVSKEHAQRFIDVFSGACIALDGMIEHVGEDIFVLIPKNVSFINQENVGDMQQTKRVQREYGTR